MGARGNQGLPPPAVQGSGGPPAKYCLEVVAVVWEPPCVAWGPAARPCCGAPRSRSPVGGRPVGQGPRLSGAAGSPGRGHLLAALPQACGLWRRRAPGPHAHWGEAVNLLRSAGPGAVVALGQVCVGGQTLPRSAPACLPAPRPGPARVPGCGRSRALVPAGGPGPVLVDPAAVYPGAGTHLLRMRIFPKTRP